MSLFFDDKQADIIDAFYTTSRYLDDILNTYNVYFDNILMILFPTKFMINVMTLILKLSISHFLMVMLLTLYPVEYISLNSFVLLENLAILLTSTLAINC